jgi:hypothetical protein
MVEHYVPAELRRFVEQRAKGCCEYCHSQEKYSAQSFSIEHIIPRQIGGETIAENLALSCQGCNNHKATKTEATDPASGMIVPLFHPRQHQWSEHFNWSADYTLVLGLTPIGRATIEAIKLNRLGVVNLRRVLYKVGEHPMEEKGE